MVTDETDCVMCMDGHKISDIDQLNRTPIDCWAQLSHDTLNRGIDQLPKRLMIVIKVKGARVEFSLDSVSTVSKASKGISKALYTSQSAVV